MAGKHSHGSQVGLILGLIGVAGLIPLLVGTDADWAMASAFIGLVLALTGFISFFMLRQSERIAEESFVEEELLADWRLQPDNEHLQVYCKGLVYEDEVFVNDASLSTLEGAGLHPFVAGKFVFLYQMLGRNGGSRRRTIIVDIPAGEQATAERIASEFGRPLPQNFIEKLRSDAGLDDLDDLDAEEGSDE
ncbi:hypothetical protein MASR1M12_04470 [Erysipelotrichia bacterium]